MSKQGERKKLALKRERLRQLTELRDEDMVGVVGGDWGEGNHTRGSPYSRCCR